MIARMCLAAGALVIGATSALAQSAAPNPVTRAGVPADDPERSGQEPGRRRRQLCARREISGAPSCKIRLHLRLRSVGCDPQPGR